MRRVTACQSGDYEIGDVIIADYKFVGEGREVTCTFVVTARGWQGRNCDLMCTARMIAPITAHHEYLVHNSFITSVMS